MNFNPLTTISPIDGRYHSKTAELQPYFSEFGLIRYRVIVEVEYFIAMVESGVKALADFPKERYEDMRALCMNFSEEDAQWIKDIEKVTNHDVKAVEYFVKGSNDCNGIGKVLGVRSLWIDFTGHQQYIDSAFIKRSIAKRIPAIVGSSN